MTSKRTCRPANPAPAGPVTCTVAVPSCPEHSCALEPPQIGLPVIVIEAGSSSAGCTVTAAVVDFPAESCTVTVTGVSAPTLAAERTIVAPATACATGRIVGLLENAL